MNDKRVDLRPQGLSYVGEGIVDGVAQRHELRISQATLLRDLAADYVFFTLALVYSRVRLMGRDPWADYISERGKDAVFQITMKFERPIFKGLEIGLDHEWNHVLWCMERSEWEDYCQWMGRIAFVDRDRGNVTRLRTQRVLIADPLYFQRAVVLPEDCPCAEVNCFWLDSNQSLTYLRSGQHPLLDPPHLRTVFSCFRDTRLWAEALLGGHPDPYAHVDRSMEMDPVKELEARVRKAREEQA